MPEPGKELHSTHIGIGVAECRDHWHVVVQLDQVTAVIPVEYDSHEAALVAAKQVNDQIAEQFATMDGVAAVIDEREQRLVVPRGRNN